MLGLPLPLGLALALSYSGLAIVLTTMVAMRGVIPRRAWVLLWVGIGAGVSSVLIRTTYYVVV